jgi:SAM-dependent methyltransferase
MKQDDRDPFDAALAGARAAAFPIGQYIGQESFMSAAEIHALGVAAGIGPGTDVLDLCCGVAGPGRYLARELGGRVLGVDRSEAAVRLASERASDLDCRYVVACVPPVPQGPFDVVLLLETMLAFQDKGPLLAGVAESLRDGGRFAFTVEEGAALRPDERRAMPDADTVWPIPLTDLTDALAVVGLRVVSTDDLTRAHAETAAALTAAFTADAAAMRAVVGRRAVDELLAAHRLWSDWLASGRVRKLAVVARREAPS